MASPADSSDLYKSQIRNIAGQTSNSPIWRTIPVQNWTTGDVISFDLTPYVISPDGSTIVIVELGNNFPSALSIVANIVTGTIASLQGGTYEIVVTATNSTGTPISNILPAIVIGLEITEPILSPMPDFTNVTQGSAFTIDFDDYVTSTGNPVDGTETLTWVLDRASDTINGITLVGSVYSGIVDAAAIIELASIIPIATNSANLSATDTFTVDVVSGASSVEPFIAGFYSGPVGCVTAVVPTWSAGGDTFFIALSDLNQKSIDMLGLYLAFDGGAAVTGVIATGALAPLLTLQETVGGAGIGFITGANDGVVAGDYSFTLVATNSAGSSLPSPTFTFSIWDDTAVIPTITGITAAEGTNTVKVNLSESCYTTANDAASYELGFQFEVNPVTPPVYRAHTYVSGGGTSQLTFTLDGLAFTGNNTVRLTYTT